jgi:chromate transporter
MRRDLVQRRGWLEDRSFLDLMALSLVLPGPNSTELALFLGRARAGLPGLLVAGAAFIGPAVALTLGLAWAYVEFGTLPRIVGAFAVLRAVVLALIVHACVSLGEVALRGRWRIAIAAGAALVWAMGAHEVLIVGIAALLGSAARLVPRALAALEPVSLGVLAAVFLKAGALLYGSGYVLFAYLRADLVERTGWLTEGQLADAIVAGQVTPGPVLASATFAGYVVAGLPGALIATGAVFLPAFLFVAAAGAAVRRVRASPALSAALEGVAAASLGLLVAVAIALGGESLGDPVLIGAFVIALIALVSERVDARWLIVGAAALGLVRP